MNDVATNQGRTVLFVSHNMGAVAGLCGRTIFLQRGEVELIGETQDVISRYMTLGAERKGTVDLTEWKDDRSQTGPFRFKRVTLTDAEGNVKSSFKYGEKIRVLTEVSGIKGMPFSMNVSIRNDMGAFITDNVSSNDGFYPVFPDDEVSVSAEFDCLFNDGRYYLQLWLGDRSRKLSDVVRNCLSFDVFTGDILIRNRGLLRQRVSWEIC